jgi:hypothetical protein
MKNFVALVSLLLLAVIGHYYCSSDSDNFKSNDGIKITINNDLLSDEKIAHSNIQKGLTDILWSPIDYIGLSPDWITNSKRTKNNEISYVLHSDRPVVLQLNLLGNAVIMDAKDSVCINDGERGLSISGRGSEGIKLQFEIEQLKKELPRPTRNYRLINSFTDYLNWKEYLDKRLDLTSQIIEKYKNKVPSSVYDWVKANAIYEVEGDRVETFMMLNKCRVRNKTIGLSQTDMVAICDSTLNGPWAKWLQSCNNCRFLYTWYFYQYNRIQIWKKSGFDFKRDDSLNTDSKRRLIYYNSLKQNYQGLLRERLLQYVVADETIKEIGFNDPVTETILKDYYSQPGFPEYKQWMKDYETQMREKAKIAQNLPVK